MERAVVAVGMQRSVITFRKERSGQPRVSDIATWQSSLSNPARMSFCEAMEKRP
jgi:hypothetical protein